MPIPKIAIVGKPNVGKSTIFNRLIGKRHAIISEIAGTTRDRIMQPWECLGYHTILVDTGGLEYGKMDNIEADVRAQAELAISEADLVLFVVDAVGGLTKEDFSAVSDLRKSKKEVLLIANKCEGKKADIYNAYELGIGDPIAFSAIHGIGMDELETAVEKTLKQLKFKKTPQKTENDGRTIISILGRPNAGKSSLVNSLAGEKKVIVSEIPGTTRDTIDIDITYEDQNFRLIDTAGIRRPGKIQNKIEKFSIMRCHSAIELSDIVILLIDGQNEVGKQDCHIAELALNEKKGLIIAINKIDLFEEKEEERNQIIRQLQRRFAFVPWAPVVFLSAKNKKNTFQLLTLAAEIMKQRSTRIPTAELNTFLQKTTYKHAPMSGKPRKPKFFYGSQVDINPPRFVLFFKHPESLHFSYLRYLENEIRREFGFNGTSIEVKIKPQINTSRS